MKLPSKNEWSEIVLVAVLAGGFSGGIAMLQRLGFDKNATFAFLGAIVGAAAAVFLSIGQQERQRRSDETREREQIMLYFNACDSQISEYLGSPFNIDDHGGLSAPGCKLTSCVVENLRNYTTQAIRHAAHLGFFTRANLEVVIENCDKTLAVLRQIVTYDDKFNGRPDFKSGRQAIVSLRNAMNMCAIAL